MNQIHIIPETTSTASLLTGSQPPFRPALLIQIDHKFGSGTVMLHWGDALFLASSAIEEMSKHARGVRGMITEGQIELPPVKQLLEECDAIANHICHIQGVLMEAGK